MKIQYRLYARRITNQSVINMQDKNYQTLYTAKVKIIINFNKIKNTVFRRFIGYINITQVCY